jgi:hypothetical protein
LLAARRLEPVGAEDEDGMEVYSARVDSTLLHARGARRGALGVLPTLVQFTVGRLSTSCPGAGGLARRERFMLELAALLATSSALRGGDREFWRELRFSW